MKFSITSLFALAASVAFVQAQDLSQLPQCALNCFIQAAPATGCGLSDLKCQCTTGRQKLLDAVTPCLQSKCSAADAQKAISLGVDNCNANGYTQSAIPSATASSGGNSTAPSATAATTTHSGSATAAPKSSGAAVANVAGMGVVGLGLMVALGL